MAKVILICGKICSGKTVYSRVIRQKYHAVLLSFDEIESQIFHHSLGENHDLVAKDIKDYLHKKAVEIALTGTSVVLDWGFWTQAERKTVSQYYRSNGVDCEWHYVDVSEEVWQRNIASRNASVLSGKCEDYYVDEGLFQKIQSLFEMPKREEMDVWYVNQRNEKTP